MPNALQTGVSGLIAHQRQLDVVANNLANINTTAFKSQRVLFSDLVYERLSPATGSSGVTTIGGTDPLEIGSGVRTAQTQRDFSQGGLDATGQAFDFAIQGEGFFVLNDGIQDIYSRSGAFSLDAEGTLIDPSTGYAVQRFGRVGEGQNNTPQFQIPGDSRIRVPIGSTIFGTPTSRTTFNGILDSSSTGPRAEILTSANPFLSSGNPATAATALNDLDTNSTDYVAGDIIEIVGTNPDGSTFNTTIGAFGATMGDILAAVNTSASGATATMDSDGNLLFLADDSGEASMSLVLSDQIGNTGSTLFNTHNMIVTTNGKDGDTLDGLINFFDVRGDAHEVSYTFQKITPNSWNLMFDIDPEDGTIVSGNVDNIQFNDDGTLIGINGISGGVGQIEIQFAGVSQSQSIAIHLGELSHIAADFAFSTSQDGNEPSKLASVRINSDGTLQGISSTGRTFDIAQLSVASFRNPNGLSAIGNLAFESTLNSGNVELGLAGSNGRGTIRGGQLEASNVDVAFEFTATHRGPERILSECSNDYRCGRSSRRTDKYYQVEHDF